MSSYSNYTVDAITILYVVFLWIISKVNTLNLPSIPSCAPPQLVTLMFEWTSLAVTTMLLLHQTVANICIASMGPVWHTFGHPSDRDQQFILEHLTFAMEHLGMNIIAACVPGEVFRESFIPGYSSCLVNGGLSLQPPAGRTCHCQVWVNLPR